MKKILLIGGVIVIIAVLAWAFMASNKPTPGEDAFQDGRNHIPEGTQTDYKFNPPTSGDHYPSWITKGFYDTPRPDGNLVHSQEHGYIIFWYNCDKKLSGLNLIPEVHAQAIQMTFGSEGSPSARLEDLPESFRNGSCDNLKNQIKDVLNKFGPHKLLAVPRVNIDYPLILTAWGKMERLSSVDEGKIKDFIDAYRDNGPEQTNEP